MHTARYKYVAVIAGKPFIQLANDGNGNFTGEADIPKSTKSLSIGCAANERGSYTTLASFKAQ